MKSAVIRAKLGHMFVQSLDGARDDVFPRIVREKGRRELAPPRAGLYAVAFHGHVKIRDKYILVLAQIAKVVSDVLRLISMITSWVSGVLRVLDEIRQRIKFNSANIDERCE